ncbi:MAG: hypothetical protein ACRDI2_24890, partial [Chloroflexota bacterium]
MESIVVLTGIGCFTAIILTVVDKVFDKKRQAKEAELRLARERAQLQELRIVEISRQNEQLRKQLEWHTKLLEAQGRP